MTLPGFGADVDPVFAPRDDISLRVMKIAGWRTMDIDFTELLISNVSTEQDLYNLVIPGGTLGTTGALMLILEAYVFNNNATNTITLRVRLGDSVAASVADSMTASTAWRYARMVLLLKANGAVNSQLVRFGTPLESTDTILATFSEDSTFDRTLRVTSQFDAASVNLQVRVSLRRLYQLRSV